MLASCGIFDRSVLVVVGSLSVGCGRDACVSMLIQSAFAHTLTPCVILSLSFALSLGMRAGARRAFAVQLEAGGRFVCLSRRASLRERHSSSFQA